MDKVFIYDTTLRDGSQARSINFSLEDKLQILKKLDSFGIDYIEGGWPNATHELDRRFFEEAANIKLENSKVAAFGSTRRPKVKASDDAQLAGLIAAKSPVITIFGKSWDLHVEKVIRTTLDENLQMIEDSIAYLKDNCEEVIYDAEHFYDGYKANPEYALRTLEAAVNGGADCLALCDTNGGMLPDGIVEITNEVRKRFDTQLGIHTHNDSGCAVANAMVTVKSCGVRHVQGTINGFGERCGNSNLCTIIPTLELKEGFTTIGKDSILNLTECSRYVDEIANLNPDTRLPYVGESAFAHKGGAHIDGVIKLSESFEHISPDLVGNRRIYVLSDQAGSSTIVNKVKKYLPDVDKKDPVVKNLLNKVKIMEGEGYLFEAAEGSFRLLVEKEIGRYSEPFNITGFRVYEETDVEGLSAEATVKVNAEGREVHTAAEGDGPVNAMDNAIRKALIKFYPMLAKVRLSDYKVTVIDGSEGTEARVRVFINSTDEKETWGTVGVSTNIIQASWIALLDSFNYMLLKSGIGCN